MNLLTDTLTELLDSATDRLIAGYKAIDQIRIVLADLDLSDIEPASEDLSNVDPRTYLRANGYAVGAGDRFALIAAVVERLDQALEATLAHNKAKQTTHDSSTGGGAR